MRTNQLAHHRRVVRIQHVLAFGTLLALLHVVACLIDELMTYRTTHQCEETILSPCPGALDGMHSYITLILGFAKGATRVGADCSLQTDM